MPEADKVKNGLQNEPLLDVDKKILRAYQAGLDSFEAGNWDAAIAACGKALEGIARNELPYNERGGTLGQLLEKLPKHVKPEQPLVELAAAVKDTNGLGAHFDLERDADEEIAKATLSLVESFINYVYMFRIKVEQLRQLVDSRAEPVAQTSDQASEARAGASQAKVPAVPSKTAPQPKKVVQADNSPRFDDFDSKADPFELPSGSWKVGGDT